MFTYLLILESIGTTELLLIGVVALMLLGPRRLPEMARKVGKIMAEFRGTANQFRETWQKEVDLESDVKAFDINSLDDEAVPREKTDRSPDRVVSTPAIKQLDAAEFEALSANANQSITDEADPNETIDEAGIDGLTKAGPQDAGRSAKEDWL